MASMIHLPKCSRIAVGNIMMTLMREYLPSQIPSLPGKGPYPPKLSIMRINFLTSVALYNRESYKNIILDLSGNKITK